MTNAYEELPLRIGEIAVTDNNQQLSGRDIIESFLHTSLSKARANDISAELRKTVVLAKYRAQLKPKQPRQQKTFLSRKERKKLNIFEVNKVGAQYKSFIPLHELWCQYIKAHLNLRELESAGFSGSPEDRHWNQLTLLLYKADFVGADLKVVRSTCSSLVGKSGIVLLDTQRTFKLIGKDNIIRTIPKERCIFIFNVNKYVFTIHGKNMCVRSSHRSARKLKTFLVPDL